MGSQDREMKAKGMLVINRNSHIHTQRVSPEHRGWCAEEEAEVDTGETAATRPGSLGKKWQMAPSLGTVHPRKRPRRSSTLAI